MPPTSCVVPVATINTAIEVMQSHPEQIHPKDAKS